MENINKQINYLEDQIRELQLEKYKIGLLTKDSNISSVVPLWVINSTLPLFG